MFLQIVDVSIAYFLLAELMPSWNLNNKNYWTGIRLIIYFKHFVCTANELTCARITFTILLYFSKQCPNNSILSRLFQILIVSAKKSNSLLFGIQAWFAVWNENIAVSIVQKFEQRLQFVSHKIVPQFFQLKQKLFYSNDVAITVRNCVIESHKVE